jgi:NAD(P)-dependent dehydrogenase (short-subunit alcohol dehydrogenase family)
MSTLEQRFPNKRVLITGAASGLGKALSLELAKRGWKVAVAGLNTQEVTQTADAVHTAGGEPLEMILDVTRSDHFEAAAQRVTEAWGGLLIGRAKNERFLVFNGVERIDFTK